MSWNDFNQADAQRSFEVIPKGTLVKVRMTIKPGGFDDPHQGWTGGYATYSTNTGSVYLNAEFVVLHGEFAKRKIWTLIGLHSENGPEWANMGRSFIRAALESARNINPKDISPQSQLARQIQGFQELDGLEFVTKVGVDRDQNGDPKNIINVVITPDHKDYPKLMSGNPLATSKVAITPPPTVPPQVPPTQTASPTIPTGKPHWAQ